MQTGTILRRTRMSVLAGGRRLGELSTSLLLGCVYVCLITPYALTYRHIRRAFVSDFLGNNQKDSYYKEYTQPPFDKSFFERPW